MYFSKSELEKEEKRKEEFKTDGSNQKILRQIYLEISGKLQTNE